MKTTIPHLKVGDKVKATLIEKVTAKNWIVSFNGDLMRISNKSHFKYQEGERITLLVTEIKPLKFKIPRGRLA